MILAKVPESETKSSTESGSGNKVPVLIPWEEHQKLIDEAARRASKETIESFRKLDKVALSDRESSRSGDTGLEGDDDDEIDFFASKTNKSIKNMVSSVATLKRAFEQPPSQIEQAMYQAFTQKTIDSLSGNSDKKKGWWDEAVASFAHGLGQRGPELVESLTRNFGSEWVKQTAQGLLNPGAVINSGGPGGGYSNQGQGGQGGMHGQKGNNSNLNQDAVDQIMALDPNNSEHVSAYAEIQGNIDINDARKMLMIHQDIFMNKMKRNVSQLGTVEDSPRSVNVPVNPGVSSVNSNNDIPPVWAQLLINKISELEKKVNDNIGISNIEPVLYTENIGKVQTAEEFQRELEEETRREKQKSGIGNVNKWEDDPSTDVGMVSHERRLEEESMRKKPVHDASADMIRREVVIQKEKLEVVTTVENSDRLGHEGELCEATFEEEKEKEETIIIPEDIKSDVDKIEAKEKEKEGREGNNVEHESTNIVLIPESETKEQGETFRKTPKLVLDEQRDSDWKPPTNEEIRSAESYALERDIKLGSLNKTKSKFQKGSQGWLKEQKELKEKK